MRIKMLALAACVISLLVVLHNSPALSQPASIWSYNGSLMSHELAGNQVRFASFEAGRAPQATASEVPFIRSPSGSVIVLGVVNGTVVRFLLDSGADLVTIPSSIAARLVNEADFVGYATFVMADGSRRKEPVVRLRSLTVGGTTLANVECAISEGRDALLGQSFLQRVGGFSIDYHRSVLELGEHDR
jgi:clan AA aspartic protease (TIGR02281 family)